MVTVAQTVSASLSLSVCLSSSQRKPLCLACCSSVIGCHMGISLQITTHPHASTRAYICNSDTHRSHHITVKKYLFSATHPKSCFANKWIVYSASMKRIFKHLLCWSGLHADCLSSLWLCAGCMYVDHHNICKAFSFNYCFINSDIWIIDK